jgi:hypothetical protein
MCQSPFTTWKNDLFSCTDCLVLHFIVVQADGVASVQLYRLYGVSVQLYRLSGEISVQYTDCLVWYLYHCTECVVWYLYSCTYRVSGVISLQVYRVSGVVSLQLCRVYGVVSH